MAGNAFRFRGYPHSGKAAKATAESAKRQADNTASQLLVAESQAKATQDQVDAIKRQMGVSERAQVKIIPDLDANIAFGANKELRIPIKLSNIGKTAATKIHIKSGGLDTFCRGGTGFQLSL